MRHQLFYQHGRDQNGPLAQLLREASLPPYGIKTIVKSSCQHINLTSRHHHLERSVFEKNASLHCVVEEGKGGCLLYSRGRLTVFHYIYLLATLVSTSNAKQASSRGPTVRTILGDNFWHVSGRAERLPVKPKSSIEQKKCTLRCYWQINVIIKQQDFHCFKC